MTSSERWQRSPLTRSQYASSRREQLLKLLAPDDKCALCSCTKPLTVDHVDGRQWELTGMSAWMRVARYWREYRAGVRLRAACTSCNSSTGQRWRGRRGKYVSTKQRSDSNA